MTEPTGKPGDISISHFNISQNPRPQPGSIPLLRGHTVRQMTTGGEWKIIGYLSEHHGPDPDLPEGMMDFGESPNGIMYTEPWFTEEERKKAFSKWFPPMSSTWAEIDFIIEHYKV